MVENLQASNDKKVEVITNPSANDDPDGVGGIINLVLKRGAFEGFNGSTTFNMTGQYNKNNIAGNLNYRSDKFNFLAAKLLIEAFLLGIENIHTISMKIHIQNDEHWF